jgi:hypothetical protein
VRSASHTGKVQLKVREYLGGVQQGAQILSTAVDLGPAWKFVTVDMVTMASGSTLDFQIIDKPVANGEVFQIDGLSACLIPPTAAALAGGVRLDRAIVPVAPAPTASAVPAVTRLAAVFPNPSSGAATVRFELAREAQVDIDVYDLRGARVRRITSGRRNAGAYSETWDGRDQQGRRLPIGLYLVRFDADRHHESRKLVLTN